MSRELDLLPDPNDVAALVENLVGSEWPTSEAQRIDWFRHHELDVREGHRGWGDNGSDSFVGEGPQRWGGPRFGWHTFEGEFVGVNWFLWLGEPPEAVRSAARQLLERFSFQERFISLHIHHYITIYRFHGFRNSVATCFVFPSHHNLTLNGLNFFKYNFIPF